MEEVHQHENERSRKSSRMSVRKIPISKSSTSGRSSDDVSVDISRKRKRSQKSPPKAEKQSRKKQVVSFKCCPLMLVQLLKRLSKDQKKWVSELGFGALLLMPEVRLPKGLVLWLIDQVDWKKKALIVRGRAFKLSKWIKKVLAIPNGKLKVPLPRGGRGKTKIRNPTEEELEFTAAQGGRGVSVQDIIDDLVGIIEPVKFKKNFMLVMLCIYLAPTSGHVINRNYVPSLSNIELISEMDWCEYVVNYLIDGIRDYRYSRARNVNVHGCVHILPLMYIDIVSSALLKVPDGLPRANVITTNLFDLLESADLKADSRGRDTYGKLPLKKEYTANDNIEEARNQTGLEDNDAQGTIPAEPDSLCNSVKLIFIDFVKHAAFEVPVGFPRLGVITAKHFRWVVSHPFTSLMVRRPEESIYAAVLDNMPKDNINEDGKIVDSESNTEVLADKFATTDTDQNNSMHPVSEELGTPITSPNTTSLTIVQPVELGPAAPSSLTGHIILSSKCSGEQVQSSRPSEPCSAQIIKMKHVAPESPKEMNSGSTLSMENAVNRSAKKARVDLPSSGQAKRAGGVAAVALSVLNCTLCGSPLKPPVFQCNGGHLACGRCLAELPDEQCQTCEHGGGFGRNLAMDTVIKLAWVDCSHDGCESLVPYHELDDHESKCPHAPCFCTEPGCGFVGPPQALLSHLNALHSVPVHKLDYGEECRLRVSEPRFMLHGVGDGGVFILTVGALGPTTVVSVVCIRADGSSHPRYTVKLSASSVAGSIKMQLPAVTSCTRPRKVVVEELPTYLVGSGASKEVTLDICIDKM